MSVRESIYNVINLSKDGKQGSLIYNLLILLVAIVNLISIWAIMTDELSWKADIITACTTFIFLLLDYILRWITADFKLKIGRKSFLMYPFTLMAIIDLLAIIPVLAQIGNGVQILKCLRFLPLFRKFNPKKFTLKTYAHGINDIAVIIRKLKVPFISASIFVLLFIIFAAVIMLFAEPKTFNESFLDALYWSVITCTTVGYGDIHPESPVGKVLTMLGSFVSVIIISLPVSVITAGITATVMTNMRKYNNNPKYAELNTLTPIEPDPKHSENTAKEEVNFCPQCGRECGPDDNYCKSCGWKLK